MSRGEGRIPVAVLGATGSVGQRFVGLLAEHPWFRLAEVCASERSAGKSFREAARWMQSTPIPAEAADLVVRECAPPLESRLVFSALDAGVAGPVEEAFAAAGHLVVSNARNHRMDPRVPLLVPEVNPDHLELLRHQPWAPGGIITNPNCSTIGLTLALKPLADAFGLRTVRVATLQAVSGAGIPGVSSMEILDNVIPYIGGEEEKMEREPRKILGSLAGGAIVPATMAISAQCNRVAVVDGHTECVWVQPEREATVERILEAWRDFRSEPARLGLPSAPEPVIVPLEGDAVPQPRLHRDLGRGMAVSVGRLRPALEGEFAFVTLSHNTIRGAAGGAILCAELAVARGELPGVGAPGVA
jgi:aspartate-semialdehyde dehydrogenase